MKTNSQLIAPLIKGWRKENHNTELSEKDDK